MRRCLTTTVLAFALGVPSVALAQDNSNCPPGAWFCEEAEVAPPEQAPAQPPAQAPRRAGPPPGRPPVVITPPSGRPPVVVYEPAPPPQVIVVAPPYRQVRPVPPPPPVKPWRFKKEWGINMRLEGVSMGERNGANYNAGMGGVGLSLRYRPWAAFAIDAGVDLVGGVDYNGFQRFEVPLSLSGMLFVNPKSKVQFYFIGGVDWSHAEVESDTFSPLLADAAGRGGYSTEYDYFGGHGGVGLEFRVSRRVGIDVDGLIFVRSRTDYDGVPEFVDYRGRTSNTSGGGLFRVGCTIWW